MSRTGSPIVKAIDDARLLIDAMRASNWRELQVVVDGTELFIARDGGRPDPMRGSVAPAGTGYGTPHETVIRAPHVGTIVDTVRQGTQLKAGQTVATIRVLGDLALITTSAAGRVIAFHATTDALVEFGAPIATLAQDIA